MVVAVVVRALDIQPRGGRRRGTRVMVAGHSRQEEPGALLVGGARVVRQARGVGCAGVAVSDLRA